MKKEDIEQYQLKEPAIVAIGERRIRAFVADQSARLGGTLWVGNTPTRIVSLAGGRRVEALAFDTSSMAVGDAVTCAEEHANWPSPRRGATPLDDLSFEPGTPTDVARAGSELRGATSGIGVIDSMLPIALGGVTLVLDCGAPDQCVDRLAGALGATVTCASVRPVPAATHQVLGASGLALAVAAKWATRLEDAALLIESVPFGLDELLDSETPVTALVRVHLRDGLEILAETLDLGHSDTQILLRADGTIDLGRSTSRLSTEADRFERLVAIREQLDIFGEHDIPETDLELVREATRLEACLID